MMGVAMKADIKEVTTEELRQQAERLAQEVLGVGCEEAFLRLDQGEYRGTIFASKMSSLRFLLQENAFLPSAAE
jgi:hypothetical protein